MKTANILDRRKESHSLISARTSNHTCCLKLIARILIFALASSSASFYFTCRSCSTLQCLDNIPGALSISATCVSNTWDSTVSIQDAVCNVRLSLRRLSLRLNLSTAQELELSECYSGGKVGSDTAFVARPLLLPCATTGSGRLPIVSLQTSLLQLLRPTDHTQAGHE